MPRSSPPATTAWWPWSARRGAPWWCRRPTSSPPSSKRRAAPRAPRGGRGRRWTRGAPQDGGGICWYTKFFPRAGLTARLALDPGFAIGGWDTSDQKVPDVIFVSGRHGRNGVPYKARGEKLGTVDPIVVSEVLADLGALTIT